MKFSVLLRTHRTFGLAGPARPSVLPVRARFPRKVAQGSIPFAGDRGAKEPAHHTANTSSIGHLWRMVGLDGSGSGSNLLNLERIGKGQSHHYSNHGRT